MSEGMCKGCKHLDTPGDMPPCVNCVVWEDGYLSFENYENKSRVTFSAEAMGEHVLIPGKSNDYE